jgi:hypothetical protein
MPRFPQGRRHDALPRKIAQGIPSAKAPAAASRPFINIP